MRLFSYGCKANWQRIFKTKKVFIITLAVLVYSFNNQTLAEFMFIFSRTFKFTGFILQT